MYEFDSVSVSTYEAASLAAKLSEKSSDGWEVVAIVSAGNEVVAYVKRADTAASPTTTAAADTVAATTAVASTPAVSEPAGWGTAPESSGAGSSWGSTSSNDSGSSWGGATTTAATTPAQPAQATPSVPAGWYHDPAGRYELRYWDGSAWTEHVSRAGQQYTDPPVA
jgi:Protein of unknown function (DUF2510)